MMPDGAEPCQSYTKLREALESVAIHLGKAVVDGNWKQVVETAEMARSALRQN
jgi:hypothetical protein